MDQQLYNVNGSVPSEPRFSATDLRSLERPQAASGSERADAEIAPRKKLSPNQAHAHWRLVSIPLIASEYLERDLNPGDLTKWVHLVASDLHLLLRGETFGVAAVRRRLPKEWNEVLPTARIRRLINRIRTTRPAFISPDAAASMIGLLDSVRIAVQNKHDFVLCSFWPIDEIEERRLTRRTERRREKDRERYLKKVDPCGYRELVARKMVLGKRGMNVAPISALIKRKTYKRKLPATSPTQADLIVRALVDGRQHTRAEIVQATGIKPSSIGPLLNRLCNEGRIENPQRAYYSLPGGAPLNDARRGAPAPAELHIAQRFKEVGAAITGEHEAVGSAEAAPKDPVLESQTYADTGSAPDSNAPPASLQVLAEPDQRGERVIGDVIEIERHLTEAKKVAEHGGWLPWLEREFGWTDETARNFIRMSDLSLGKSKNISGFDLPLSGLISLARPSTPEAARDGVTEHSEAGEKPSIDDIKRGIETAMRAETAIVPQAEPSPPPAYPGTPTLEAYREAALPPSSAGCRPTGFRRPPRRICDAPRSWSDGIGSPAVSSAIRVRAGPRKTLGRTYVGQSKSGLPVSQTLGPSIPKELVKDQSAAMFYASTSAIIDRVGKGIATVLRGY